MAVNAPADSEQRSDAPPQAAPDAGAPRAKRLGWVHAATDRLPTSWLGGIATAAFLAVTAGFGGLAAAETPALPEIGIGDEHVSDQLSIVVERAVLIDEFPEAGVEVEPGERVLALLLTAENRWTQPLATDGADGSVSLALRIPALGDVRPDAVARYDDATRLPILQPGVPAQLVVSWAVDAEMFAEGDDLRVDVRDATLYTGQLIIAGDSWGDPVTAAHLTATLDDVGAGADAEVEE